MSSVRRLAGLPRLLGCLGGAPRFLIEFMTAILAALALFTMLSAKKTESIAPRFSVARTWPPTVVCACARGWGSGTLARAEGSGECKGMVCWRQPGLPGAHLHRSQPRCLERRSAQRAAPCPLVPADGGDTRHVEAARK